MRTGGHRQPIPIHFDPVGADFRLRLFGDLPDAIMLAGAAIVVASGLYILYRETRHGQEAPPVMKV